MGQPDPDSLAAVQLDDLLIAALAAGDVADEGDPALALLAALRRDVSGPAGECGGLEPAVAGTPAPDVAAVVPLPRRARPRLSHAVLAAGTVAAILSLGGVAAASVQATPNSALYPVRVLLLGPVTPAPLDVVHALLASAAAELKAGDIGAARQHLAAAHHHLAALQQSNVGAEQALSKLESQVAAVAAPSPSAAAVVPTGTARSTGSPSATGAAASASPSTPTTVDSGPQIDGQVSAQPSPTGSGSSTPPPSPTSSASPSGSASPSPTASASPQRPHDSATPAPTPSGGDGSTTPTSSPSS